MHTVTVQEQGHASASGRVLAPLEKVVMLALFHLRGSPPLKALGDYYFNGVPRRGDYLFLQVAGKRVSAPTGELAMLPPGNVLREYALIAAETGKVEVVTLYRAVKLIAAQLEIEHMSGADFCGEFRRLMLRNMDAADQVKFSADLHFVSSVAPSNANLLSIKPIGDSPEPAARRPVNISQPTMAVA